MELVVAAVIVGVVGGALWWWRRTSSRRAPRLPAIDPFTIGERWRRHVTTAQGSLRRYREIVAGTPPGPLRDQLAAITRQVEQGVSECGQIAKRGDELDTAAARIDLPGLRARLAATTDEATQTSLESRIATGERLRATRDGTDQQLRRLNDRLGELVAQAAEVSVGTHTTGELGTAIDDVVTRLEALRLAIDEVDAATRPVPIPPEILAPGPPEEPGQATPST